MNQLNAKKLLHTKWTAAVPKNKEKHFLVSEVEYEEDGTVALCKLEAVMTKNENVIDWHDLKDKNKWLQGWK